MKISNNKKGVVNIKFLNLSGQIVKSISDIKSTTIFNKSYDVSHLSNGIYFILIKIDAEITAIQKVIID